MRTYITLLLATLFVSAADNCSTCFVDAFQTPLYNGYRSMTKTTTTTTSIHGRPAAFVVSSKSEVSPMVSSSLMTLLSSSSSDFDFPSAMPAKPELTLEEKMQQSADDFVETMTKALKSNNVDHPPELDALIKVRKDPNSSVSDITLCVYNLMIERGMLYDEDPETGALTPTTFDDIPNNLDIPEVKQEFLHLYKYGMMLMDKGLISGEQVKDTVIQRLIARTGLTPEKFDEWLGF